jgi:glycosyltransferase involved in cell wall biosynthesis
MRENNPIRVLHIARMKRGGGVASVLISYYRNIDRSKVQFDFLSDGNEWETFENEIKDLGGVLYKIPNYKQHFLQFILLINKIVRRENYSIIHTHELAYNIPILAIAKINGISHRYSHSHIQDGDFFSKIKKHFISIMRPLYGFLATERFACSQNAGKFLYGKLPFEIIPNAINIEKFLFSYDSRKKIRNNLSLSDKNILLGYVARFEKQKNHLFLVDVLGKLFEKNINVFLLLVGDGTEQEKIKQRAKEKNVFDKIIF